MSLSYRRLASLLPFLVASLAACKPVAGEPGTTESTAGTLDLTSSGSDTPTSTGATSTGELPSECETTDPAVSAAFSVEFPDWPPDVSLPWFEYVVCTVDGVTSEADAVTTMFTCDVEGTARPVVMTIAAAPEGEVPWVTDATVRLRHGDFVGEGTTKLLDVRSTDGDDVLLLGLDWTNGDALEVLLAPLTVDIELICDPAMSGGHLPTLIRFGLPDGQADVGIASGHRGVLPIDADNQYVIDVAEARGSDLHPEDRVNFLLRWITVDG